MIAKDFAEFVTSQQVNSAEPAIDWNAVRDGWLRDLDTLHGQLTGFLHEYVERGTISYAFSDLVLTEGELGTYTAKQMDIKIGRQLVHLEPVGTLLIGCKGRVDVVGPVGRVPLFLVGANVKSASDLIKVTVSMGKTAKPSPLPVEEAVDWVWKIVSPTIPRRFIELETESFFAVLMEVANA